MLTFSSFCIISSICFVADAFETDGPNLFTAAQF